MRTASGFRVACLTIALALVAVGCAGRDGDDGGDGVRGGTLQVLSADPEVRLDTDDTVVANPIAHTYARTLYGYNLSGPPEQKTVAVPDIASGHQLSADQRTYTFTLRPGVRYAPPVNREVTATDFITAIQRLYDKQTPSYWQQYSDLIAGARRFGAGKASRISGLTALDARTLKVTLDQPAGDFLSILALPGFAPVPGEYAASYAVGENYWRACGRHRPLHPNHLHPRKARRAGPQPQLGSRHRPPAQGLGRPHPRSSSTSVSRRSSRRSSTRTPTCR